ncbi:MAG: transcription antitermination factor NusB [Clostridia bacterium]|nr:transcription antitermination factor NusB [Clostridia bacterium]
MSRREERKEAFKLLFSSTFGINNFSDDVSKFAKEIFDGVNENILIIDDLIKKNIRNWKFERISRVAKSAMRMGIYEVIKEEIPAPVAINEAVEMAKIFGSEEEANYVQAVLTSVANSYKEYIKQNNFIVK